MAFDNLFFKCWLPVLKLFEYKKDRKYQQDKTNHVIPFNLLFEYDDGKYHEYNQSNNLLYRFQLNNIKRSAGFFETNTISRHLENIFKKSKSPANEDNRH